MQRGDVVRIKSTGQIGVLGFESQPYTSIFKGQIIQGFTIPTVLVPDSEGNIRHISASDDDLEVIE